MITIKVDFEDGDSLVTRFNGTLEEAKQYYIDKVFNMGCVNDNIVRCIDISKVVKVV